MIETMEDFASMDCAFVGKHQKGCDICEAFELHAMLENLEMCKVMED